MKKFSTFLMAMVSLWAVVQLTACKDEDDPQPDVLASFTYIVDTVDFKKVSFTNESQNYDNLSWNFGDNTPVSAEEDPVHTYAAVGVYTVTLTASTDGGDEDVFTAVITISDPNAELTKLVGDASKTWKLLRDVSTGNYPLEVGPFDRSTIWWAVGLNNDELANRPCILNDEWTFHRDGKLEFNANGDYWAEGGVFTPDNICASTADPMLSTTGEDLSPWGGDNGNWTFELTTGTNPKLKALGHGAFIGFLKSATEYEITKLTPKIQESVEYNVVALVDGNVDTLIIEANYRFELGDPNYGGYWRYVLVHYDNPNDEPPIPGPAAVAKFSVTSDGLTVTCTNSSEDAVSYLWDFGDGNTSTATNPTHTYADGGAYTISLTATNPNGFTTATKEVFLGNVALTDDLLQGGAWHVRNAAWSVVVGPGIGDGSWWQVPANFLDGSSSGVDDWSCMVNDEFIFSAGGVYEYRTNGDARNDGYMGSPNGCISDAQIAASGNGAAFGSGVHSYTFTPAAGTDRAKIVLTNGASGAAFIGFYKGYYGGENSNGANAPNGGNTTNQYEVVAYAKSATQEWLYVSVDISGDHSGSASWSMVLVR